MEYLSFLNFIIALLIAPMMLGIINKTKAFIGGRNGPPLLQSYYDLIKLVKKDFLYSRTTSYIFRISPLIGFASILSIMLLIPFFKIQSIVSFESDILFLIGLFAVLRFFTVIAALDTGSSFEGMGSSREVFFGLLTEPIIFLSFIVLALLTKSYSLSNIAFSFDLAFLLQKKLVVFILFIALFIVLLSELSRIPIDDPNTHLELTMIHEVMILDYSGFDLALILYGLSLKMLIFSAIILSFVVPYFSSDFFLNYLLFGIGLFMISVLVGIIESIMARLRLNNIPKVLIGTNILVAMMLFLILGRVHGF